jgi:hypothetical protein
VTAHVQSDFACSPIPQSPMAARAAQYGSCMLSACSEATMTTVRRTRSFDGSGRRKYKSLLYPLPAFRQKVK